LYALKPDLLLADEPWFHTIGSYGPLPPTVDLRSWAAPTHNQKFQDCTGYGTAHFREWWAIRFGQPYVELAPLFPYNEARLREHTLNQDNGARPRDVAWTLTTLGICPETDFPEDPANLFVLPPASAIQAALPYKLETAYRLAGLVDLLHCLSSGYPAIIGMGVTAEWELPQTVATGIIPVAPGNATLLGGHETLAIGYTQVPYQTIPANHLIIQNSWGPNGLNGEGFYAIPFSMVNQYLWSAWTFRNPDSPATLPLVREATAETPVPEKPKKKAPAKKAV